MLSFTMSVKNEISLQDNERNMEMIELSAFIRNNGKYDDTKISLSTENNKVAKHIYVLIKKMFNVVAKIDDKNSSFNRNRLLLIEINQKVDNILKDLYVIDDSNKYMKIVPEFFLDSEDEKRAYLRGVFLATGSVNDPKTSRYHLEFLVSGSEYANFINEILNSFNLNSKVIKREKNYMVYVKESEKISDFLRLIKAYNGVMYFEDIRIYRDHKNMTNRLNNCEQANVDKIFMTASRQLRDIEKLKKYDLLDVIDNKLLEVVKYREKYPESSLGELADIMSKELGYNITKSGLNHRFRKIRDMILKMEA